METCINCKDLSSTSPSAFNSKILRMPAFEYSCLFVLRNWIIFMFAFAFLRTGSLAVAGDDSASKSQDAAAVVAQDNSAATAQDYSTPKRSLEQQLIDLRLGPFDLHPRLIGGVTYDDNILYSTSNRESTAIWTVQPGLQAVAGDDAALIAYRDQRNDVLDLSPGNFIIEQPQSWPGKLLILDYAPRFQLFDKYTVNNSIDEFATLDLLWPMGKLILGLKQQYQLQKEAIIEVGERTAVEFIPTTLSAAYQFGDKTSVESDLRRLSYDYATSGLVGYTEYNTENWFNYNLQENLPVSAGVLAGIDDVADHQGQTYEQLRVRARYIHSEKLSFDASVGGELRQFENGSPEKLSPVFTIVGEYRLSEWTALRLTGYRQIYASIFNGFNYASTGATLEARHGFTDRYTAILSTGYYSLEYTPVSGPLASHTDGYYNARISFEAKIIPHLNGQVFGYWVSRQSQFVGNMNDSQVGVLLSLGF